MICWGRSPTRSGKAQFLPSQRKRPGAAKNAAFDEMMGSIWKSNSSHSLLDDRYKKTSLRNKGLRFLLRVRFMSWNKWLTLESSLFTLQAAMRRTFQRTQEFCDEAQKYMDLVAQEEADARRPGTAGLEVVLEVGVGWWLVVVCLIGFWNVWLHFFRGRDEFWLSGKRIKSESEQKGANLRHVSLL